MFCSAILIPRQCADGFRNMAIDEYLLELCRSGQARAALRFYGWEPPAVSLGYSQSLDLLDLAACRENGVDVVKRITGGGAILHCQELTYCFVISWEAGAWAGAAPAWRRHAATAVSKSLVLGLTRLGVRASGRRRSQRNGEASGACPEAPRLRSGDAGNRLSDLCFASGVENEIEVDGRKLAGCAHKYTRDAFFSHGSVMTGPGHVQIAGMMRPDADCDVNATARSISENSVSLSELLPAAPPAGAMEEAFRNAFEEVFGLRFVRLDLSGEGATTVEESAAQKRSVLAEATLAAESAGGVR